MPDKELSLLECGYTEADIETASPDDMNVYYSKDNQQKYGVVGIRIYLSGNGPLVAVLTEALAKDNYQKCRDRNEKKNLSDSRREVGKFIQIIHRYRDNMLAKIKNPVENGVLEIDP